MCCHLTESFLIPSTSDNWEWKQHLQSPGSGQGHGIRRFSHLLPSGTGVSCTCVFVCETGAAGLEWGGGTSGHSSSLLPAQLLSLWALYIQMDIEIDFEKILGLIQPYWAFSLMPLSVCCACQWLETRQRIRMDLLCVSMCSKCVSLSLAEPTVHFVHHRQTQRHRPHKGRRNAGLWENQGALCHRHRQGNKQLCPRIFKPETLLKIPSHLGVERQ